MIKLKTLLTEMPRVGSILSPTGIQKLENYLNMRFSDLLFEPDLHHLYGDYYLVYGFEESHVSMWCSIVKKINQDGDVELVFGSKLEQIDSPYNTKNKVTHQVKSSNKFDSKFKDAYKHSYLYLCTKIPSNIVCDENISTSAASSWINLLKNKDLINMGVKPIVINKENNEEITEYNDIGQFFLNTDKTRKYLVGVQPK